MTQTYVLDASVALSWLLPDESNAAALALRTIAVDQPDTQLAVPPIFWPEVVNVLTLAVQRDRVDQAAAGAALKALQAFGIEEYTVDLLADLTVAVAERMSAYDAQYLVLAQDLSASVWTLDTRLGQVARQRGIPVAP
ncbi:MAG: type II toxin-antitoxin system VapC family toxin [Chloroflexi bacterium]|nr:type II toxin-antitoxin system VapC family toxin [Chloroflexota bacterium]